MFLTHSSEAFQLLEHSAVALERSHITFSVKIMKCDWNFIVQNSFMILLISKNIV